MEKGEIPPVSPTEKIHKELPKLIKIEDKKKKEEEKDQGFEEILKEEIKK
jgi:hypothetical protein